MASKTQICNRALTKIGPKRIADLTEESEPARVCADVFTTLAQAEIRRHAWSFALKRAILAATVTAPAFGYATAYNLPADCLRLVMIDSAWVFATLREVDTDPLAGYAIEGRQLLTNHTGALNVRYVQDLSGDTSAWDASFVEAFACRMAVEIAPSLTKISEEKLRGLKQMYGAAVKDAQRANAIELPPSVAPDGSWVTARYAQG